MSQVTDCLELLHAQHLKRQRQMQTQEEQSDDVHEYNDDFYEIINEEGMIDGPFIVSKVANIFVSHYRNHCLADSILWVRPCQPQAHWYKLNLLYLKQDQNIAHELCSDLSFYKICGNLFRIIEKLKQIGFYYATEYPHDVDNESLFHILTVFINYGLFCFSLFHIHILIYFFYLLQTHALLQRNRCLVSLICLALMLMAILTACCVAYMFVYVGVYNELQSWMIGYIAYIAIQWIEEGVMRILFVCGYFRTVFNYDSLRLSLLGIRFKRKNDIIEASGWHNCWISSIFALLPSSILTFIANYIFEAQFTLQCDMELLTGDICYQDGRGCCMVVSSHDLERYDSMFDFLQTLASNIIAVYGLIRIVAWFMVTQTKQYRGMAQKSS